PFLAGLLAGLAATLKTTAVLALVPVLLAAAEGGRRKAEGGSPEPEHPAQDAQHVATEAGAVPPSAFRLPPLWAVLGWLTPAGVGVAYFAGGGGLPYLGELLSAQMECGGGDPRLVGRGILAVIRILSLGRYLPLLAISLAGLAVWVRDPRLETGTRLAIAVWW